MGSIKQSSELFSLVHSTNYNSIRSVFLVIGPDFLHIVINFWGASSEYSQHPNLAVKSEALHCLRCKHQGKNRMQLIAHKIFRSDTFPRNWFWGLRKWTTHRLQGFLTSLKEIQIASPVHLLRGAAQDKMLRLHESIFKQKPEANAIIFSCDFNGLALKKTMACLCWGP